MMNYRMTAYILGSIAVITAGLMLVPFIMTFGYHEDYASTTFAFGLTIAILLAIGIPCIVKKSGCPGPMPTMYTFMPFPPRRLP